MRHAKPDRDPLLSLVIPAFNEVDNIKRRVLHQVAAYLDSLDYECEVIVVDDGSEDETPELVEQFCSDFPHFVLLRNKHAGKAYSVVSGMLAARGRYRLFIDMDLATPLTYIPQFQQALEQGSDIVIASRAAKGAVRLGAPWTRYVMGKTFNLLVRTLLLPGISDTQCGFKAFRREAAQDIFGHLVLFENSAKPLKGPRVTAFDVELLVLAKKRGYTIQEIPVRWQHFKTKRVNAVRDAYRMFKEVMQISLNNLRGKYDVSLREANKR